MSCSAYMDPYMAYAGGYLANPNATSACAFCPFRTTDAYLQSTYNMAYGRHWRDLGIVLGAAGFNVRFPSVLVASSIAGGLTCCRDRSCLCLRACTSSGCAEVEYTLASLRQNTLAHVPNETIPDPISSHSECWRINPSYCTFTTLLR